MGNVYMEADQVRFKNSTYRNVQEGLAAALEGGGGGGTTVVANPEGSATADLAKLQVGTTIYGIPAEAGDISYDNTSSGLTADDVQEAIDELNTGLSGVTELIPSGATASNKLATASDIPDAVTGNPSGSATAGNLTKLQIGSDIYNVPSGSDSYQLFTFDVSHDFTSDSEYQGYKYTELYFDCAGSDPEGHRVEIGFKTTNGRYAQAWISLCKTNTSDPLYPYSTFVRVMFLRASSGALEVTGKLYVKVYAS